ncbi:MAG: preprotein translocase subunit SecA [Actinomycetota bacterium]
MILDKLLRAGEGKRFKKCAAVVPPVNSLETDYQGLSDSELREETAKLRARLADGEALDDVLPEGFALVREAAKRALGQRHFDVQLIGGAALHFGMIAEMKTGEGKTLVATLPSYLNALEGKGVHVVTVNDYLAKRDAEWMGGVHRMLGLSVGLIQAPMTPAERRPAYGADITYGTNNEFGFDYLRDNMAVRPEELVHRGYNYSIVDEVDSILVDEARTPLIISGPAEQTARWYVQFARIAPRLHAEEHYEVDEAKRTVAVTEEGVHTVETMLGVENLYDQLNTPLVHHLQNSLRAKELYRRDVDYIVKDGEVLIVDEFTGRVLHGRRYSEGLHQAIEAKENVRIREENQTYATITLQNYFRMYSKLAGMTGTAMTEATEFDTIYKLQVVEIPTNRSMIRLDEADVIYKTPEAKWDAVVADLAERNAKGQPVLVGTISIEKSEKLSGMLTRKGIPHTVLNAKHHEKEAHIIAQAGRVGGVTVATNMAGRGVDILLGGNSEEMARQDMPSTGIDPEADPEAYEREYRRILEDKKRACAAEHEKVVGLGGLYVLGTERHESRRIDNQLRGRSGRQGDPGESRFYLSLGDDLMRLFNTRAVESIMTRLKVPEDVPIEAKMVSRAIRNAQRQVESQNFEIRKNVLKYDEVMNKQREVIYAERKRILEGEDLKEQIQGFIADTIEGAVATWCSREVFPEEWDFDGFLTYLRQNYPTGLAKESFDFPKVTPEEVAERALEDALAAYDARERELTPEVLRSMERHVLLQVLDRRWREHLYEMDYLQEGIGLRAIGQRDPLVEYQREGFDMFQTMMEGIKEESVGYVYNLRVVREEEQAARRPSRVTLSSAQSEEGAGAAAGPAHSDKIPRNDPCPCGSGRKYKRCHGAA